MMGIYRNEAKTELLSCEFVVKIMRITSQVKVIPSFKESYDAAIKVLIKANKLFTDFQYVL